MTTAKPVFGLHDTVDRDYSGAHPTGTLKDWAVVNVVNLEGGHVNKRVNIGTKHFIDLDKASELVKAVRGQSPEQNTLAVFTVHL